MTDVRTQEAPTNTQHGRTGPNPPGDFIWYELMTDDVEGAKAFYEAVVGWKIHDAAPEFNGYRMIQRADGRFAGGFLPITNDMQQHGARPTWLGYINVDDVDAAVAKIEAAGGKGLMPPIDIPMAGRIAMVADPQGAIFYVMKPIPPAGREDEPSDVFSPKAEQRIGWNELQTTDQEAARRFYGEQFGWNSDEFFAMGESGEYRFWDHHGLRLGAVFDPKNEGFDAKNERKAAWRYYIRVPSISAAKDTIEQKGGTVAMGPQEVPTGDWIIVGKDPQGAEFALTGGE